MHQVPTVCYAWCQVLYTHALLLSSSLGFTCPLEGRRLRLRERTISNCCRSCSRSVAEAGWKPWSNPRASATGRTGRGWSCSAGFASFVFHRNLQPKAALENSHSWVSSGGNMGQGQDILFRESGHLRVSPWCHVTMASPFPSLI